LMMEWRCQDSVWNNKPAKVILIRDVSDHKQAALERSVETERIRTQESTLLQILKSPEFPSVKQAVEFIAELVSSCLMVERVSIWFLDDDRASLRCETLYRRSVRKHDEEAALHAGEFPRYFEALQNLRVINADDAASDPRTSEFASGYLERNHIGSMMDAGVRVQGVLRGVLCCEHTEGVRNWHADEMTFAGQVADQIAQVLLKRQEKTLQERLTQMERMETVGNLAGGIAHDFNNLLTPIMGYADLVYQELPAESALRKDLLAIQSAAERAKSLARQLLMFSRKSVAEMKVHDLRAIITDFLKILRRTVREDIIIDYRSGLELMPVVCDVSQMEQILMNLAVNAQDAMPKGGKMIIELARIHLEETAGSSRPGIGSGEFVELKFGDTGRGMDSFIQKRIFEPFFTTKEMGKGTGLGLATVYGIVRQHRGHIELHSEVDKGTTFTVFFPVAANQKTATRHESKQAGDDQGWESVCVVEDDEMVRQLTVKALQQKGYTTFSYESPHACLQDFESGEISFALLLSDVIMPGMSGKELYEILHARKPDLKVIYMSGYSDNVISAHDLLDSDAHFLQKPFTLDILAASVRNALGH
ncbi:MAG: response regulator, partial [Bacteroidetes bacterium]|nr:response regulator [Bacteroidota bacterium]